MFDHVNDFRPVYYALVRAQVFPLVRQHLLGLLSELIERECRAELTKLKKSKVELPIELFVSASEHNVLHCADLVARRTSPSCRSYNGS